MPSMSAANWPNSRVLTWLLSNELTHFLQTFATQGVSGALLLEYAEKPDEMDKLFAPGVAEPERPTPTQISALKHAVQNLADKENALTQASMLKRQASELQVQSQIPKTLDEWRKVIRTSSIAHDELCRKFRFRGSVLTLLVVTLNTIVTSAIFSTISDASRSWLTIAAGTISVLSAVLTSIRSALGYETLAESHRSSGLRYAKLWTRFDDMHGMRRLPYMDEEARKQQEWSDWFKDYQDAIDTSPIIAPAVWDRAAKPKKQPPTATTYIDHALAAANPYHPLSSAPPPPTPPLATHPQVHAPRCL